MTRIIYLAALITLLTAPHARSDEPTDSMAGRNLSEITVTANSARQRVNDTRIGAQRLELSRLASLPSFGGEKDIIKSLALLPGVRSEGDGGGGFEVRGGNSYQNLVVLDGITLYNPSHVMGIFSTFNDNALGSATLFKGPFPAGYGGASSSVLDTSLAAGDMESWHGSATVSILAAKAEADGPIVKNKLSAAVAARRSYVDAFLKMVPQYRSTVMNFYDISAKVRFRPSAAHLVDANFFVSRDNMAVDDVMGFYWGNLGASLNWVARSGNRLTFTTLASMTRYTPKMSMDIMNMNQTLLTYIHNYSLSEKITIQLANNHTLETGLRSELLKVKSAEWLVNDSREIEIRSLWENALWLDYSGRFADRLELITGARLNCASVLSQPRFHKFISLSGASAQFSPKTYIEAEPRVSVKYLLGRDHSLKAGFGLSSQNLHALRLNNTSFPSDRFALTSADVKPERAAQWAVGYAGMTSDGALDWSAEAYYRNLSNVYDFKDGRSTLSDIALENIILGGKGRSYGLELMVRKNSGPLTGWVSYTLSRTQTRIAGINNGQWYNSSNDHRHDLTIAATYRLSDRWSLSGSWLFLSGQPLTAPDVKYEVAGITCYYYSGRNTYKTPPIHRLDLSASYTHEGKRFTYQWDFGIYNAYCRYNPYIIYFEDDPASPSGTRAVQQALYGLIPSVSYTLKF